MLFAVVTNSVMSANCYVGFPTKIKKFANNAGVQKSTSIATWILELKYHSMWHFLELAIFFSEHHKFPFSCMDQSMVQLIYKHKTRMISTPSKSLEELFLW